jgi:hypothetical protein
MMKRLKRHLIKIGLALIIAGFLFELFFAGRPFPDSPEELVVNYNRNETIAIAIMQLGLVLLIIGVVFKVLSKKKANIY